MWSVYMYFQIWVQFFLIMKAYNNRSFKVIFHNFYILFFFFQCACDQFFSLPVVLIFSQLNDQLFCSFSMNMSYFSLTMFVILFPIKYKCKMSFWFLYMYVHGQKCIILSACICKIHLRGFIFSPSCNICTSLEFITCLIKNRYMKLWSHFVSSQQCFITKKMVISVNIMSNHRFCIYKLIQQCLNSPSITFVSSSSA